MVQSMASHAIAPAAVLRGDGAWGAALPKIAQLCRNPLLLGRSPATQPLRDHLISDLNGPFDPSDCWNERGSAGRLVTMPGKVVGTTLEGCFV